MKLNSGMFIPMTENTIWARAVKNGGSQKHSKYHPHPMQSKYIRFYSPVEVGNREIQQKKN